MKRVTVSAVNKALAAAGIKAELIRSRDGGGYHYFAGEDMRYVYCASEYTPYTNDFTVERWVEKARALQRESKEYASTLVAPEDFALKLGKAK